MNADRQARVEMYPQNSSKMEVLGQTHPHFRVYINPPHAVVDWIRSDWAYGSLLITHWWQIYFIASWMRGIWLFIRIYACAFHPPFPSIYLPSHILLSLPPSTLLGPGTETFLKWTYLRCRTVSATVAPSSDSSLNKIHWLLKHLQRSWWTVEVKYDLSFW